jgi:hypothetical protein
VLICENEHNNSGILLHASQSAFLSEISGHVKTLLLHRRRLVLLVLFLCISLHALFQFVALLMTADTSCRVVVRFTLLFDQLVRASALALAMWRVCDEAGGAKMEKAAGVGVVLVRVVVGGVVVGYTQGNYIPACFPEPRKLVVGCIAIGFDVVVWTMVLMRIVWVWGLPMCHYQRNSGKSQGYGVFLTALSFLWWTLVSAVCLCWTRRD